MTVPAKFKEYIWLVNTIHRFKRMTFAEINRKWLATEMSEGIDLARSTFNRHKDAIEDIFGIYIDCDRNDGYRYFIGNEEVLQENSVQNWMLSTLTVNNIISESLSLQDRILLEEIPCDDHLQMVIDAMKQKVKIEIEYRKYGSDRPSRFELEPYCIKLFRQRWYVLGHFQKGSCAVFSFDRILEMSLTGDRFEIDPEFNAQGFFEECFGVVAGDGTKAQRIVLRAFGNERFYLGDLPIHRSQKEIAKTAEYTDFELLMRPTYDFKAHILSRGQFVQVIEPKGLAAEIKQMLIAAASMYE